MSRSRRDGTHNPTGNASKCTAEVAREFAAVAIREALERFGVTKPLAQPTLVARAEGREALTKPGGVVSGWSNWRR